MAAFPDQYQTTSATPGYVIGVPRAERMTLQREANDLLDQINRANAILDQFSPSPSTGNASVTPLLPLGQALAASRDQMEQLIGRMDGLLSTIGQI